MQRNFDRALARVLVHEGGFVNHPSDPGGATNLGITLATFRRYVKRNGTVADLKALTIAQAGIVYRKQFWDRVNGYDLPDGIDYAVFDFAVNSGQSRAAKYLQAVLGVAQDGLVGPITIAAARRADPVAVIGKLCADRMAFLRRLKTWPVFGRGWTSRVTFVEAIAKEWAREKPPTLPPVTPEPVPQPPTVPESQSLWARLLRAIIALFTPRN